MKIYTKEIKDCWDCPAKHFDAIKGERYCSENGYIIIEEELPDWCPLPDKEVNHVG